MSNAPSPQSLPSESAVSCQSALDTNRRQDSFLAILGHELRNPLAATIAAAAVLHERLKDVTAPFARPT